MRDELKKAMEDLAMDTPNKKKRMDETKTRAIEELRKADAFLLITIEEEKGRYCQGIVSGMTGGQFIKIFKAINEWLQQTIGKARDEE